MNEQKSPSRTWRWLGACAVLLLCAGVTILAGSVAWLAFRPGGSLLAPFPDSTPVVSVPPGTRPPDIKLLTSPTPSPPIAADQNTLQLQVPQAIIQAPIPANAALDFTRHLTTTYPWRDYVTTAATFSDFELETDELTQPPVYREGERTRFMTIDGPREAELIAISTQAYFWAELGLSADHAAMQEAAVQMDGYYGRLTELFGEEQRPGIDQDNRLHVLHYLGAPDVFELGYFDESNQFPDALFLSSNEREMIYLNMSRLEIGSDLYYGTLVHELQHLIQWNLDRNEAVWLNEGLSQLAEKVMGLDTAETVAYLQQPGIRLDHWEYDAAVVYAHYAASYLYAVYLWEQLGSRALWELTRQPDNGLAAVAVVLAGYRPELSLAAFTADWAVANYLDDPLAGAAYGYETLDLQRPFLETRARRLPFETIAETNQYSVDYIDLDFSGPATITFAGDTLADLTDAHPPDNPTISFAPGASNTHATLTADVDLTNAPTAKLEFDAWYNLEAEWDFVYLSVSADGGQTWSLLYPENAISGEFGPAFGGSSRETGGQQGGWVHEAIDLDRFAGRPLRLRFELLTDFDNPSRGFAVTNLAVAGLAGAAPIWQPEGFVVTNWQLPQQWSVRLIREGAPPEVIEVTLDDLNRAQLPITLGPNGGVLVVMPQTPFVDHPANYWLQIAPSPGS